MCSSDALLGHNSADPVASTFGDRKTHVCMCVYVCMCICIFVFQSQEQSLGPEKTILQGIINANEENSVG